MCTHVHTRADAHTETAQQCLWPLGWQRLLYPPRTGRGLGGRFNLQQHLERMCPLMHQSQDGPWVITSRDHGLLTQDVPTPTGRTRASHSSGWPLTLSTSPAEHTGRHTHCSNKDSVQAGCKDTGSVLTGWGSDRPPAPRGSPRLRHQGQRLQALFQDSHPDYTPMCPQYMATFTS